MPSLRLNVNIVGEGRVFERVRKVGQGGPAAAGEAPQEMGKALYKEVESVLNETSYGMTWNEENKYWQSHWRRYNDPSARRGEPINQQDGDLLESIRVRKTSEYGAALDVTSPYAKFHEITGWTSPYGKFVAQRPFVRPALERLDDEFTQIAISAGRREML